MDQGKVLRLGFQFMCVCVQALSYCTSDYIMFFKERWVYAVQIILLHGLTDYKGVRC